MNSNYREWTGVMRAGQVVILAASLAWVAGCSTAGYKKSDAAALSMQTASAEVEAESGAAEIAVNSLKTLVNEPGADLRPPFRHFSTAVDRLATAADRTRITGERMAKRSAAYFESWDKHLQQIEFVHVRDVSATRMTEVTNQFAVLHQRYRESQEAVQPLITYLRDIRTALSTDLTSAGLVSVKDLAENAATNANKVRSTLAALTTELGSSSARLSSMPFQSVGGGSQPEQESTTAADASPDTQ